MAEIRKPLTYAKTNRPRFVAELGKFIRFPTVSAQTKHAKDIRACASWLADHLRRAGLARVRVVPTARHPFVYGEWLRAPGRPTVLIYGHYDVQPADPLPKWHTPPFTPTVRGPNIYGRGASDDKGPLWAHVKAIEAYLKTQHRLPVNVRCIFDGEEEIGSPSLEPYLKRNRQALVSDVAVMSDTRMLGPDRPAITYSERGALGFDLELFGPKGELHSGQFGGAVHNPLQVICALIARLHDPAGRIVLPGFYDRVRRWSRAERAYMARVGPSDREILRDAQVRQGWGEPGYTLYERTTIRPALTLNGITSGYGGSGGKAGIPPTAKAKLSFRLVSDQDPREIEALFRQHVARITPPTVRLEIKTNHRAHPIVVDRKHPAMRAAVRAYQKGFGVPAVFIRSGGTIPLIYSLRELLGIPTVLMGFALPDDRMHAPNEKLYLPNLDKGIATSIWFLALAAEMGRAQVKLSRPREARCELGIQP